MIKIGIIVSSVRQGRFADHPAKWLHQVAGGRSDIQVEMLDLRDYPMPLFDEAGSPAYQPSKNEVAQRWQEKVAECDGFVVITAEYNHGPTAAIKNALDYAYNEWVNKPIGFVAYGGVGGARAVEQLRLNAIELQMVPIRNAVHIQWPIYMAVTSEGKTLDSYDFLQKGAKEMLDQLVWWAKVMKQAREALAA
jgi:NAD(P)H-dependent FMN reductase